MKYNFSNIKKAKLILDKHECVAIPTETVYGLAANAYSNKAVNKIFLLKKIVIQVCGFNYQKFKGLVKISLVII